MNRLELSFTETPQPKLRPRFSPKGNVYTPDKTRGYEESVTAAALQVMAGRPMAEGFVRVTVSFYIPMPVSWTKKRQRETLGQHHLQKPDKDNFTKALLDACQGVIYRDDSQVAETHEHKYWAASDGGGFEAVFEWE